MYWFCHISTWIHNRYTRVPHPEPSSLPIPSLWVIPVHQPQASSIVHGTWTGDSFHIWYYTCFNAILPNHPTLSLSHRVQKTVLYHLSVVCKNGTPWWLDSKESTCNAGDLGSIPEFHPWTGKIPWRRKRQPTPVFCLENTMDREVWRAAIHGVAEE